MRKSYILILILSSFFLGSCVTTKDFKKSNLYNSLGPYLYYYEGMQNRLYGNPDEAIESLLKSVSLDSTNNAAYYELALSYSTLNNSEKSLQFIRKAYELEPKNKYYNHFLVMLLLNQQKIQEAYKYQKQLIELDSTNTNYKYQLALLASDLGDFDLSLKIFNQLEERYGYIPRLSETKAKIFLDKKNNKAAKNEIEKLIEHDSNNPIYYLYLSELYFRQGKDSLGFDVINEAKSFQPNSPHILIELYQRNMQVGNYADALKSLENIYSHDDFKLQEKLNFFKPLLYEQQIYATQGEKLDNIVQDLLNQYSESLPLIDLAYEHYIRRSDYAKARECLELAFELDDDNPDRLERIITFDYSFDRKENVIYNSLLGIKKFPQNYIFYIFNALGLEELDDIDNAIKTIKKGIRNVDDDDKLSELYATLGDFYYQNSQNFLAYRAYRNGLNLNPENTRILNNFSYYLSEDNRRLKKALEMSTKAVELEPNNSTFLDTKGWVLFKLKKYKQAKDVIRQAISKGGDSSAVINEHYGDVLYKTGSTDSAYMYWLKASEIEEPSDKLKEKLRKKTYVP